MSWKKKIKKLILLIRLLGTKEYKLVIKSMYHTFCKQRNLINYNIQNDLSFSECPKGIPIVTCAVNPCDVSTCPAFPKARCQGNYCGGCKADFFVDGDKVDCCKFFVFILCNI